MKYWHSNYEKTIYDSFKVMCAQKRVIFLSTFIDQTQHSNHELDLAPKDIAFMMQRN